MDARLQRRVQRYGWDLAAGAYEPLWRGPLALAQRRVIECAGIRPGDRVLDVACGTGLVSFEAARLAGPTGLVTGVDLSGDMVAAAGRHALECAADTLRFLRMDAERLELPDATFDVALCALGLMYVPDPGQALREMRRVLRPGGRLALAVWGERSRCGWAPLFGIVDDEVRSDVCPLFFALGQGDALARLCRETGFTSVEQHRLDATLLWMNEDEACDAAFAGGPVALAWSRMDAPARSRARRRYLEAISPWRHGAGYRVPGEFVVVAGVA